MIIPILIDIIPGKIAGTFQTSADRVDNVSQCAWAGHSMRCFITIRILHVQINRKLRLMPFDQPQNVRKLTFGVFYVQRIAV